MAKFLVMWTVADVTHYEVIEGFKQATDKAQWHANTRRQEIFIFDVGTGFWWSVGSITDLQWLNIIKPENISKEMKLLALLEDS